jgi:hypothetical protein
MAREARISCQVKARPDRPSAGTAFPFKSAHKNYPSPIKIVMIGIRPAEIRHYHWRTPNNLLPKEKMNGRKVIDRRPPLPELEDIFLVKKLAA